VFAADWYRSHLAGEFGFSGVHGLDEVIEDG
jgi:hypothetical protein